MKSVVQMVATAVLLTILVPMTWALVALPALQIVAPRVVLYQLRLPIRTTWYGRMVMDRADRQLAPPKPPMTLNVAPAKLTADDVLEASKDLKPHLTLDEALKQIGQDFKAHPPQTSTPNNPSSGSEQTPQP